MIYSIIKKIKVNMKTTVEKRARLNEHWLPITKDYRIKEVIGKGS